MWKALSVAAAVLALAGCSNNNRIEIQNLATNPVWLNFRAQIYRIPGINEAGTNGGTFSISEIPNGTYDYKTMWDVPDGYSLTAAAEGDGNMLFDKKDTRIMMQYGSLTSGTTYITSLTITSSLSTLK
jgi:hypothetical protein